MSRRTHALLGGLAAALFCSFSPLQDQEELQPAYAPVGEVVKLATGMGFTEGPVWMPEGECLIFSDIPRDELKAWKDGELWTFRKPSHKANGNRLDMQGRLVTCEHGSRTVTRTDAEGNIETLIADFEGLKFNSPNDLVIRSDGTIWFTDPHYGLDGREREIEENNVYCYEPQTGDVFIVVDDFVMPNGLALSPDEKKLYVADSGRPRHIRVFDVAVDGALSNGELFCMIDVGGPDGIRCDVKGRLFSSAGDGVHVFAPTGRLIGRIPVPESPSNLCFGGPEGKTLFITARTSLYSVEVDTPGRDFRAPAKAPRIPDDVDLSGSFTLRMKVRIDEAPEGLPTLAANKDWTAGEIHDYTTNNAYGLGRESGSAAGFALSVLPDGAWTWNVGDGKYRLDHRPEARDQGIADGRWHEIGFSIDRERGVAHLFHDGRRVALHDLGGLGSLDSGSDEIQIASDGVDVDDIRVEPGVIPRTQVADEFASHFGEERRPAPDAVWNGRPLRVLAWNIWHGGRRKGRDEGVQRVHEVIEACGADIVLMQETYGSGPRISGRLGFDYYLRSSNLSVMSRFPIVDVHQLGPPFRFGGVTIELRPGVEVQAYSLWINHLPSVQKLLEEGATADEIAAADDQTRGKEMRAILAELMPHLAKTPDVPVIVGGDFNSGSHLDWTPAAAELENHAGRVVAWPVSCAMAEADFVDTYRAAHPDPVEYPGLTWSPEFPDSHQDRIDYVYVRGSRWHVENAYILNKHPEGWPSDHAASLAILRLGTPAREER